MTLKTCHIQKSLLREGEFPRRSVNDTLRFRITDAFTSEYTYALLAALPCGIV